MKNTGDVHWNAFGGLVPSKEKQNVLGILMPSACFQGRSPKEGANYAFFIGGACHPEYLNKTDEELTELVNTSLHTMLGYPKVPEPMLFVFIGTACLILSPHTDTIFQITNNM